MLFPADNKFYLAAKIPGMLRIGAYHGDTLGSIRVIIERMPGAGRLRLELPLEAGVVWVKSRRQRFFIHIDDILELAVVKIRGIVPEGLIAVRIGYEAFAPSSAVKADVLAGLCGSGGCGRGWGWSWSWGGAACQNGAKKV